MRKRASCPDSLVKQQVRASRGVAVERGRCCARLVRCAGRAVVVSVREVFRVDGEGGSRGIAISGFRRGVLLLVFFFFSSRRRHTRSDRDWSSDVCSSDLPSTTSEAYDQPVETSVLGSFWRLLPSSKPPRPSGGGGRHALRSRARASLAPPDRKSVV